MLSPQDADSVELVGEPSPVVVAKFSLELKAPHDLVDVLGGHHCVRIAAQKKVAAS